MTSESSFQRYAQWLFSAFVVVLSLWILHGFLAALAWAGVIALATWPLYKKFRALISPNFRKNVAPFLFTLVVSALFVIPLAFAFVQLGIEVQLVARLLLAAQREGLIAPEWLHHVPLLGDSVTQWWNQVLGTPGGIGDWLEHVESTALIPWAKVFGRQMLHRSAILGFTLLALFFLYRDGILLSEKILRLGVRLLGQRGEGHAEHAVLAVRATVNGLVLVGIGEGILIGAAYALAGVPSATVFGAITGLLSMIPFAAPLIFGGISLFLLAQGKMITAILIFSWGTLVLFIADHFVRPVLIGGSIKLPFIWVLLGILGGLETFGLLGLFLGPVVMAMGVSLWREWTEESA